MASWSTTLQFNQENERSWWLQKVGYRRPTADRPLPVPLPFGCSFDERRSDMRARLGAYSSALLLPVDRWEIGELSLWVMFDREDERPTRVQCWPPGDGAARLIKVARWTSREQWLLYNKLVIGLRDDDHRQMLLTHRAGGDPADLVRQHIEDFRVRM